MAIYPFTSDGFVDKSVSMRQQVIETIDKLRRGESFEAYKEKFVLPENTTVSDEDLKKLYISYNFMEILIEKIVAYCPNLEKVKTGARKRRLIKDALIDVGWHDVLNEVYDILESKGDAFLEIYFNDSDDTIPRLRVLTSENMKRALLDDYNRYHSYIYREYVEDLEPNYTDDGVRINSNRERIIVFQKGRKVVYDQSLDSKGTAVMDDKGNYDYNKNIILNRPSYISDFPLIHIKGRKKQSDEFSKIPAESYIDLCLTSDQNVSDIRQANRMLGHPVLFAVDLKLGSGATMSPSAIIPVSSIDETGTKQGKIQDVQIKNDLKSMFAEFTQTRDYLYDKAGLITPTLREKLNVDSGRVVHQLNLQSENKIELYVDNIIDAMRLWFKILLKENNLYSEKTDKNLSFIKPDYIIKSSPLEELLLEASKVKQLKKSRQETYVENMDSDEEIAQRKKEINEELGDDNKDKSFTNSQLDEEAKLKGVDKNMIP